MYVTPKCTNVHIVDKKLNIFSNKFETRVQKLYLSFENINMSRIANDLLYFVVTLKTKCTFIYRYCTNSAVTEKRHQLTELELN